MVIEYIPDKWRNLRLEYTDEYLTYLKELKLKKESIHEPKIMKKPGKIIVNNPIKQPPPPVSILINKSDVNKESHRCEEVCVRNKHKCTIL